MQGIHGEILDKNADHYFASDTEFNTYDYLLAVLSIVVIFVNFTVVLSSGLLLQRRQQPRSTYIFLGNISLSDMILGVVTLFIVFYPHQLHSEIACSISMSLATTAAMVSVLTIGLIGIDRYLYILYGLHYQRYITSQRSHCMVFSIWLLGGLLGFMLVFGLRNPMEGKHCWFTQLVPPKIVLLLTCIGIIPMALIFVLYSIILKNALKRISRLNCAAISNFETHMGNLRIFRGATQSSARLGAINENEEELSRNRTYGLCCRRNNTILKISPTFSENKWKAVKVVVFTTGAFFITWFPYFVAVVFHAFCDFHLQRQHCTNLSKLLSGPLSLLSLTNSLLNPIIYAWWHNGFRESAKAMYHKLLVERFQLNSVRSTPNPRVDRIVSMRRTDQENFENEQRF